jgi:hypothetical protein
VVLHVDHIVARSMGGSDGLTLYEPPARIVHGSLSTIMGVSGPTPTTPQLFDSRKNPVFRP